jgi:hypothetical protein
MVQVFWHAFANVGDTVPVGISFGDSAAAVAVAKVSDCLVPLHHRTTSTHVLDGYEMAWSTQTSGVFVKTLRIDACRPKSKLFSLAVLLLGWVGCTGVGC